MNQELTQALSHILWIGGATDSGKSTVAQKLGERHQLQVYHYDRRDSAHHEQLATTLPAYRAFLDASLDERWVYPEPEALLQRALQSFRDRFPLVLEDLLAFPNDQRMIAEGFGLLPDLLTPLLSSPSQAIWLVPTEDFKWASMQRRGKPSFGPQTSDPERARLNLFRRDRLLAAYIKAEAQKQGYRVCEVNGSRSIEAMAELIEHHFVSYLFN